MAGARRLKLNDATHHVICECIANGCNREVAAKCADITGRTLYSWLRQGSAKTSGPFLDLFQGVKKAEAAFVLNNLKIINTAAPKNWTAAAWLLERKYPEEWGNHVKELKDLLAELKELKRDNGLEKGEKNSG